MGRAGGALTAALVNPPESTLAAACDIVLPIGAGPELSVAATKSFVASLAALLRLTALWAADENLSSAGERPPERVAGPRPLRWTAALAVPGPRARPVPLCPRPVPG